MNTIQIKRGLLGNMPILLQGELAYAIDTNELYVGTPTGNKMLSADMTEIEELLLDYVTTDSLNTNLADYVKTTVLNTRLGGYVTTTALNLQLTQKLEVKPDGYNDLVIGNKINSTYIDNLYITDIFVAANETTMLALHNAKKGDFAIRTDLGTTFALKDSPSSTLANWVELPTPAAPVLSVNGKTGTVSIGMGDISMLEESLNSKLDVVTYEFEQTALKNRVTAVETGKVNTVTGKGLSTNDYTTTEKNKLSNIQAGAQVNRTIANEAQAKAGASNTVTMTPLRVADYVENATIDGGEF